MGMAENAIQEKPPLDMAVALFVAHAVSGSEHENLVAAKAKRIGHRGATIVKSPCVMRRVEIGQDQDFHVERSLVARIFFDETDLIADANPPSAHHLSQNPETIPFRQFAQAGTDRIHLRATRSRFVKKQNCFADLNLLANEGDEVSAAGFDIRPDGAGRYLFQAQRGRVFGNLFTLD
jgi:hypothetical protein